MAQSISSDPELQAKIVEWKQLYEQQFCPCPYVRRLRLPQTWGLGHIQFKYQNGELYTTID